MFYNNHLGLGSISFQSCFFNLRLMITRSQIKHSVKLTVISPPKKKMLAKGDDPILFLTFSFFDGRKQVDSMDEMSDMYDVKPCGTGGGKLFIQLGDT